MTARVTGHFGEWMQGRLGPDGPVVVITLPCADIGVTATRVGPAADVQLTCGASQLIPPRHLAAFFAGIPAPAPGQYDLTSDCAAGLGTGMSTAALLALSAAAAVPLDGPVAAAACLRAEGASDPLMYTDPDRLLWASRRGTVLGRTPALPAFDVVGGFLGAAQQTDAGDAGFDDIADLWAQWQVAARSGDAAALAALAAQSAQRTTARRGPHDDPMQALAKTTGALGHIRAHTGAARGLIFAAGTAPAGAAAALQKAGLRDIRRFCTGGAP